MCDCQVTAHVECLHVVQRYVYRTQIELYSLYLKLIQLKLLNVLQHLHYQGARPDGDALALRLPLSRNFRRRRLFHSAEGRTTTVRRGPQRCAMVAAAVDAAGAFLGNDRTSLMLMDHDLRELHRSASLRADGSSTRGRKTKHDTATRRWIDTVGFPMLAQGRLPDAHDIAMLRSGPRHLLSGTALAARDAWSSQLHQGDNAR